MANWCNNNLVFEGTEKQIREIDTLFQQMIDKGEQENCGQLPNFIKDGNTYFFSIDQQSEGVYRYETKWRPNIDEVCQIAEKLGITDYVHEYEELGNLIYGKAIYKEGTLIEYNLEDEDFEQYQWNEDDDTYTFADEIYQSEWEILDLLLEDRINNTK
ncbi:hypothetical protein EQP59_02375 [Ornithobacterium rhinotracheale]|uniref:YubB ferredoxin-like domain-containing protein n=1 Tax=Ornithobacterium rhinotracheale TaxID=28251 RepID=A0A3R6ATI8_ORNRH|nr:hypothetical protein [Ornithobacterium rhinotracheale]QAR30286.1 hypothetical protein EQP59_02375 [Ornithobacterium rhinotracheale]